jgi:hypothetical protein
MFDWRERARAMRIGMDRRGTHEAGVAVVDQQAEPCPPQQAAFARRIINEVVAPVLREFVSIVTDVPGKPVYHEHDKRTLAMTCDLDARRFTVKVYLLPDATVRLGAFLTPSHAEGDCKDFGLDARNEEIEGWLGDCLNRLYENR